MLTHELLRELVDNFEKCRLVTGNVYISVDQTTLFKMADESFVDRENLTQ